MRKIFGDWNKGRLICGGAMALAAASAANVAKADPVTITETGTITSDTIYGLDDNNLNLNLVGQPFTLATTFDNSTVSPVSGCSTTVCNYFGSGSSVFTAPGYSLTFPTGTTTADTNSSFYAWGPSAPGGQPVLQMNVGPFGSQTVNGTPTVADSYSLSSSVVAPSSSSIPNPLTVSGSYSTPTPGSNTLRINGGSSISALVSGLTITNNASSPPVPPPVLDPITTYTPSAAPAGDVAINYTGEIDASGTIQGGPVKIFATAQSQTADQSGPPFSYSPYLGPLVSSNAYLSSQLTITPTITNANNNPNSPVYALSFNQTFTSGNSTFSIPYPTFTSLCANGCAPGIFATPAYTLQTGQLVSSIGNGGAILGTFTPTVLSGSGSATGPWSEIDLVNVQFVYQPLLPQQYLEEALTVTGPADSNADQALAVSHFMTGLRTWGGTATEQEPNARDAEYFALGYDGGQTSLGQGAQNAPTFYNLILGTGPVGVAGWKITCLVVCSGGGTQGGYLADIDGLAAGLQNESFPEAVANYGNNAPSSKGTGTPSDPLVSFLTIPGSAQDGPFTNSLFKFNVANAGDTLTVDPSLAKNMVYAFAGNDVTSLTVQPFDGEALGQLYLSFLDKEFQIKPGDTFDFSDFSPYAQWVDNFTISWDGPVDPANDPDFEIALQFVNVGDTLLDVTTSNAVDTPEPSSLALLSAGLVALGAFGLRRSRAPAPRSARLG